MEAEKSIIQVLTVDDHPLVREGIAAIINTQPDMRVVAQAATGREALQILRDRKMDVILVDLRLPDANGIDIMVRILTETPGARIVILTTFEGDVEMQRALQAGARGYLLKSMPPTEIFKVIRSVHAGRKHVPSEVASQLAEHIGQEPLTARELQVLHQVACGNRNKDIGDTLSIAEDTVKVHIKHIMEKLGANDRTQAVAIAVKRGFLQL